MTHRKWCFWHHTCCASQKRVGNLAVKKRYIQLAMYTERIDAVRKAVGTEKIDVLTDIFRRSGGPPGECERIDTELTTMNGSRHLIVWR